MSPNLPPDRRTVRFDEALALINDGDLAQFRRPSSIIARLGRGDHSHSGKFAWWGGELMILEMLQFSGGRAVTAISQVRAWPGRWDVYEANPDNRWPHYDREGSTAFMRGLAGAEYGYTGLALAALLHLPFVRCVVRADTDDRAIDRRPPFCSHACALADRLGGGVDPVKHLADRLTEPADLARSSFYRYKMTLV